MAVVLIVLGFVALTIVSALIRGFVLSILWAWFAVPLGIPAISVVGAIGIALLVGMLTKNEYAATKDVEIGEAIGGALFGPFLVLFMGWIIHLFM